MNEEEEESRIIHCPLYKKQDNNQPPTYVRLYQKKDSKRPQHTRADHKLSYVRPGTFFLGPFFRTYMLV